VTTADGIETKYQDVVSVEDPIRCSLYPDGAPLCLLILPAPPLSTWGKSEIGELAVYAANTFDDGPINIRRVSLYGTPVDDDSNNVERARSWHNPDEPCDVNVDKQVTPQDVLLVINALNSVQKGTPPKHGGDQPCVDVTDDGLLTPLDALTVINRLNDLARERNQIPKDLNQHGVNDDGEVTPVVALSVAGEISQPHDGDPGGGLPASPTAVNDNSPLFDVNGDQYVTEDDTTAISNHVGSRTALSSASGRDYVNDDLEALLDDIAPDVADGWSA
jgi:hypothetical protein